MLPPITCAYNAITMTERHLATVQKTKDRFEVIVELLEALQALPADIREVHAVLDRLEQDNALCYAVLKQQGWLLKDQQLRLNSLQA